MMTDGGGRVESVSPTGADPRAPAGSDIGPGAAPVDAARSAARAAFLARITAGATHEIRNVLAIVKESAGLVGDLVDAAGPGGTPDPAKVGWALDRIRLQVARGAELSTALNRVMHGLDEPEGRVELEPAVAHAVLLARRSARQHECGLEHVAGADGLAVTCSGLDLSMALVGLIEWCVERMPATASLEVEVVSRDDGPAVRFAATPPDAAFGDPPGAGGGSDQLAAPAAWVHAEVRTPEPATLILLFHRHRDETDGGTV